MKLRRFGPRAAAGAQRARARVDAFDLSGHVNSAALLQWPLVPVGGHAVLATDWVHNIGTRPLLIGRPTISAAAGQFAVVANGCAARSSLRPGQACAIRIAFAPTAAGVHTAVLHLPVGASLDTVALQGSAPTGYSGLITGGDNYVDGGQIYALPDGSYQTWGWSSREGGQFTVDQPFNPSFNSWVHLAAGATRHHRRHLPGHRLRTPGRLPAGRERRRPRLRVYSGMDQNGQVLGDEREQEGVGLARAGATPAEHVAPGKGVGCRRRLKTDPVSPQSGGQFSAAVDIGQGRGLDRCRGVDAETGNHGCQGRGHAKRGN